MTPLLDQLRTALSDRFEIEREIGRGGMATVFLATDLRHDRQVAIKVLHPELAAVVGHERFLREIKILASLNHPNILGLIDSGEADGLLYYVMPFVEGESLRQRLRSENQLPIEDAVQITREVADALNYAHGMDIVHRDIKPENIMILAGHAVVTDFGIARAVTEAGGDQLTQTGLSVGTPFYMSPEQATGSETIDARSDLYSLGCVLYEMVGGEPPYTGPSSQAILSRHSQAEIPQVSIIRAQTPPHLEAVIEKALAKSPADRFRTAEQMGQALSGQSIVSAGKRWEKRARDWRKAGLAAASVAVIAAGAYGTYQLRSPASTSELEPAGTIVVLPFFEQGEIEAPLDGHSVAQIVSNQLRAGKHRPVNQGAVRREVAERCEPQSLGRICGGRVAGTLNARYYVFGTATRLGSDSVSLIANPVDLTGERTFDPVALRGSVSEAIPLLDTLSVRLWLLLATEGERAVQLAGISTDHQDALAAFVNGEAYLSDWKLDSAWTAFSTAVEIDSTFAVAWFRRALVADWNEDLATAQQAIARAEEYSAALSVDDRRMLAAFRELVRGNPAAAEEAYTEVLAANPDDVEALLGLGTVRWAYNWRRGRPMAEAVEPLSRVIELSPKSTLASVYLFWALAGTSIAAMDSLEQTYPNRGFRFVIAALGAIESGDSATLRVAIDSIETMHPVYSLGTSVILCRVPAGTAVPDLRLLSRMASSAADSTSLATYFAESEWTNRLTYIWRVNALIRLAAIEVGGGRLRAADSALDRAEALGNTPAVAYAALLASHPMAEPPKTRIDELSESLRAWNVEETPDTLGPQVGTNASIGAHIRLYAAGLLFARTGDYVSALENAGEIEALAAPDNAPTISIDLAQALRAQVLFNQERFSEALQALDRAPWHVNYGEAWHSPFIAGEDAAFLRARILHAVGRYDEALAWYVNSLQDRYMNHALLAPSHYYRGEIYETLGDTAQAIWHYEAFAELWKDADPEYQVKRAEVLRHVAELQGEPIEFSAGD